MMFIVGKTEALPGVFVHVVSALLACSFLLLHEWVKTSLYSKFAEKMRKIAIYLFPIFLKGLEDDIKHVRVFPSKFLFTKVPMQLCICQIDVL